MAALSPPPPSRSVNPAFEILPVNSTLVRLFDPTIYATQALTFRSYGPLHRFDHHQVLAGTNPGTDPNRRIYYAAPRLSSCLVEIFGDTGFVDTGTWHVASLVTVRALRLLDLRGSGAMRAGTIAAIAKHPNRVDTQQWSRWFYDSADYQDVQGHGLDGLLYYNAHNDEEAVALYERAENALTCPSSNVIRLDDSRIRTALLKIMNDNNLTF